MLVKHVVAEAAGRACGNKASISAPAAATARFPALIISPRRRPVEAMCEALHRSDHALHLLTPCLRCLRRAAGVLHWQLQWLPYAAPPSTASLVSIRQVTATNVSKPSLVMLMLVLLLLLNKEKKLLVMLLCDGGVPIEAASFGRQLPPPRVVLVSVVATAPRAATKVVPGWQVVLLLRRAVKVCTRFTRHGSLSLLLLLLLMKEVVVLGRAVRSSPTSVLCRRNFRPATSQPGFHPDGGSSGSIRGTTTTASSSLSIISSSSSSSSSGGGGSGCLGGAASASHFCPREAVEAQAGAPSARAHALALDLGPRAGRARHAARHLRRLRWALGCLRGHPVAAAAAAAAAWGRSRQEQRAGGGSRR